MISKSEKTTKYIIETVAPIFNQKGYAVASMSDLTAATGLTKGAIYGNFKNKVVRLDTLFTEVSSSLTFTDTNNILEKRKDLFKQIRQIESEFTHYEHFMYNDGPTYSTSSAPGVGNNLAGTNYNNSINNDFTTLQNQDGFDKIYRKSEDGVIHLFTDVFNVEYLQHLNSQVTFNIVDLIPKGPAWYATAWA